MSEVLGYEKGTLGIPSLSSTETVEAPRKLDTSVATAPSNTSPEPWAEYSKVIAHSINSATTLFNLATQAHKMDAAEAAATEQHRLHAAKIAASTEYFKFNSEQAVKDTTTDTGNTSAQKFLDLRAFTTATLAKIEESKELSSSSKDELINHVYSMVTPDIKNLGAATLKDTQQKHLGILQDNLNAHLTTQFKNGSTGLAPIISGVKPTLVAMSANGKDTSIFEELTAVAKQYSENSTVINQRFNEASQTYEAYQKSGKDLPPHFENYYNELSKMKQVLDNESRVKAERKQAAAEKVIKDNIQLIEATGSVNPNIHYSPTTFQQITHENVFNIREAVIKGFDSTELAKHYRALGYSEPRVKSEIEKYVDNTWFPKQLQEAYRATNGGHMPLSSVPSEFHKIIIQDIQAETQASIKNALVNGATEGYAHINKSYSINPQVVAPIVADTTNSFYKELLKETDPKRAQGLKTILTSFIGHLDKGLVELAVDKSTQLKLKLLLEYPIDEAKLAIAKLNNGTEVTKSVDELKLTKAQKDWFKTFPTAERKEVLEDYAMRELVGVNVNFKDFKESYSHRVYKGMYLNKEAATAIPVDDDRDALLYYMEHPQNRAGQKYAITIPENSIIQKIGEMYAVYSDKGTLLVTKTAKSVDNFIKLDRERRRSAALFEKNNEKPWYTLTYSPQGTKDWNGKKIPTNVYTNRDTYYK